MQRPRVTDFAWLGLLASIWGSSFLLIKYALVSFSPITMVAGRVTVAAVSLWIVGRMLGHRPPRRLWEWRYLFLIGLLGNVAPFFLIAWGEIYIDSALAAILIAFVPISTTVMAHFLTRDEKMTGLKTGGVLTGFLGVILIVGGVDIDQMLNNLVAQLAVLLAAFCYALAGIFARRVGPIHPTMAGACVSGSAAVLTVPAAIIWSPDSFAGAEAIAMAAVVALGLGATAGGSLILFHLIRRTGATFVSLNNYLVPVVATVLGVLILDEQLSVSTLAGFLLILIGVGSTSVNKNPLNLSR